MCCRRVLIAFHVDVDIWGPGLKQQGVLHLPGLRRPEARCASRVVAAIQIPADARSPARRCRRRLTADGLRSTPRRGPRSGGPLGGTVMNVGTFRVRRLVPVAALATIAAGVGAAQWRGSTGGRVRSGDRRGRHRPGHLRPLPAGPGAGRWAAPGRRSWSAPPGPTASSAVRATTCCAGSAATTSCTGAVATTISTAVTDPTSCREAAATISSTAVAGFDRHFGGSGNDTLSNGEVNDGGSGQDRGRAGARPVDISATHAAGDA